MTKGAGNAENILLFMHTFPSDLKEPEEQSKLNGLIGKYDITLVDMGHTHYNEITNNGQTVFTATRSTGQIEEGLVGYSIITVNDGIVGWRFKHLADPFPFVMVTKPADYRMLNRDSQFITGRYEVAAVVLGSKKTTQVVLTAGTDQSNDMIWNGQQQVWLATAAAAEQPLNELTVRATDESGRPGQWTIKAATNKYQLPDKVRDGSDADTIGAWPENGVMGTQLGPNSNGKPS